jgi:hypothetical protein
MTTTPAWPSTTTTPHCFGCGWHGGRFHLADCNGDGLTFPQALETLAQRAGIPLRTLSPEEQQRGPGAPPVRRRPGPGRPPLRPNAFGKPPGRWNTPGAGPGRMKTIRGRGASAMPMAVPSPLLGHPQAQAVADALKPLGRTGGRRHRLCPPPGRTGGLPLGTVR